MALPSISGAHLTSESSPAGLLMTQIMLRFPYQSISASSPNLGERRYRPECWDIDHGTELRLSRRGPNWQCPQWKGCEILSKTFVVTPALSTITFWYAVVFQNPERA